MKNTLLIIALFALVSFDVQQSITNRSHLQVVLQFDEDEGAPFGDRIRPYFLDGYRVVAISESETPYTDIHHTVIMEK